MIVYVDLITTRQGPCSLYHELDLYIYFPSFLVREKENDPTINKSHNFPSSDAINGPNRWDENKWTVGCVRYKTFGETTHARIFNWYY
jgi:hypothetical protein